MRQLLLIVNILICGSLSSADICSHLPGYTAHGTSCFKLYTTKKTWAAAEASCVADGGHLASIHSREEQAFVSDFGPGSKEIWIGVAGVVPNMAWSDNTNMDYTNWYGGEPDENGEGCGRLKSSISFLWADMICTNTYHYICRAETQAYFMLMPDGVPVDAAVKSSTRQTVWSAIECAAKCQTDPQCVHFTLAEDGGKYRCETYTSLYRPPTATLPTDNYKKIV